MAAFECTSDDRMTIYRSLFLLNHSFHLIVQRLDDLNISLTPQDLKDLLILSKKGSLKQTTCCSISWIPWGSMIGLKSAKLILHWQETKT